MNYSYKGIYGVNFTARYDGSNQLGPSRDARWLPTWNASASWNAHEESWFKKFIERTHGAWSYAKLRFSYSLVGEQTTASNALPIFRSSEIWRPQATQQEVGIEMTAYGNEHLTYAATTSTSWDTCRHSCRASRWQTSPA